MPQMKQKDEINKLKKKEGGYSTADETTKTNF